LFRGFIFCNYYNEADITINHLFIQYKKYEEEQFNFLTVK